MLCYRRDGLKGDNNMNAYTELRNRHQERVNALPIMWAFSMDQFRKEMERMGVTDKSEIVSIGNGGYMRKEEAPLLDKTFEAIDAEMKAAIEADTDGTGFIKDMFLYELANHEYCITYDLEPTLDACGLTEAEVLNNTRLLNGLKLATKEYLRNSENY